MDWLKGLLRDNMWDGIVGIITLVGILFAIANDPERAARNAKNLLNASNKLLEIAINKFKDLLTEPINFIWAYGWDIFVVLIIYAIVQGQEGISPEAAKLLGLLFSACWIFARMVVALQKENRELRAKVDALNNWATQMTEWIRKRDEGIDNEDLTRRDKHNTEP